MVTLFRLPRVSSRQPHLLTELVAVGETQPLRSVMLTKDELHEQGKVLAESHSRMATEFPVLKTRPLLKRVMNNLEFFERSYEHLIERTPGADKADSTVDWFLDNFHLIQQHAGEIKQFFPKSFERTLPKIAFGDLKDYPRVYEIALQLVAYSDAVIDSDLLNSFLQGYQSRLVLSSGELWAIPIMLKIAVLENVRRLVTGVILSYQEYERASILIDSLNSESSDEVSAAPKKTTGSDPILIFAQAIEKRTSFLRAPGAVHLLRLLGSRKSRLPFVSSWFEHKLLETGSSSAALLEQHLRDQAANQVSIANSITSLRNMSSINWREWFEANSRVHEILTRDPADIYPHCDFMTRDHYRHEIEKISEYSKLREADIAARVVDLASTTHTQLLSTGGDHEDKLKGHVGYYLLGGGHVELHRSLAIPLPRGVRLRQTLEHSGFLVYLIGLGFVTSLLLSFVFWYQLKFSTNWLLLIGSLGLFFLPATEIATHLLQWFTSHLLKPSFIPKMDFEKGIPNKARTLVVVHGILDSQQTIDSLLEGLRVRALANEDSNLSFALLADFPDSTSSTDDNDEERAEYAHRVTDSLNILHNRPTSLSDSGSEQPLFFLFLRKRTWNQAEEKYMGWERKRGKIEELNHLILDQTGKIETTFLLTSQERAFLTTFKYVITLDSDTQLPSATARRLAATLAHPLNHPVYDEAKGRVVRGYSVIQPRVSVSLRSASVSRYAEVFSLASGFDPYTHLVSNFYQDLTGEGSYLGKGIYNVQSFTNALQGKIPENSVLSHDLFEGIAVRVGFASDIEVYDDFPSRLATETRRAHRWIRGDWQILPWLFSFSKCFSQYPSLSLGIVGWWKLFDNLRRSLVTPCLFTLLVASWLVLPGHPFFWLALIGLILAFPLYTNIAHLILLPPVGISLKTFVKGLSRDLWRQARHAFYSLAFLPTYTYTALHAVLITLYRLFISRRHLLEWQTAQHTERGTRDDLAGIFRQMLPALVLTVLAASLLVMSKEAQLAYALPIVSLWLVSPLLAKHLSNRLSLIPETIADEQQRRLDVLAKETWRYFRDHHKEEYHYLIPDNLQIDPQEEVALRTSPTNIGLSLVALRLGYDYGFDPLPKVVERIKNSLTTVSQLERWHGHILNWFDLRSARPLYPRYVSSVDSGNLVASLLTLQGAFDQIEDVSFLTSRHFQELLNDFSAFSARPQPIGLEGVASVLERAVSTKQYSFTELTELLGSLAIQVERIPTPDKERLLKAVPTLSEVLDIYSLLSWFPQLSLLPQAISLRQDDSEIGEALRLVLNSAELLSATTTQCQLLVSFARRFLEQLATYERATDITAQDVAALTEKLDGTEARLRELAQGVQFVRTTIRTLCAETDFSFLFNKEKSLFSIGYNVDEAKLDEGTYDLLASEARITSLVAIAKGDVPPRHWFTLGRLLGNTLGGRSILSWSGTMFEYLMPYLFLRDYPRTLIHDSYLAVINAQIKYGELNGVPWGISESAYSRVDLNHSYQYKAFGVPGLGLKRGLEQDLVIAPYATILALPLSPSQTLANLDRLEEIGARGSYGFYESIDFTKERLTSTEDKHVVRAFFAHHLGMSLLSLANVRFDFLVQRWFHSDPSIQSVEVLLHEKFPVRVPLLKPPYEVDTKKPSLPDDHILSKARVLTSPHTRIPRTHLLSNGKLTTLIDNSGSGQIFFERDTALTRWLPDRVLNNQGLYVYLYDLDSEQLWSTTYQPTCYEAEDYEVIYSADKVEFKRRDYQILTRTEITVAQEDHVEIRRIQISNLSNRRRRIEVTSFGEVVLGSRAADTAHPAFSKMFIETEFREDLNALVCARRPRSSHETATYLIHAMSMPTVWNKIQYESSRSQFIGRGSSVFRPRALQKRSLDSSCGLVLDPVVSLRTVVEIEPGATEEVSFITGIAKSEEEVQHLGLRYRDPHYVTRAFEMSWSKSSVEIRNAAFTNKELHLFQILANFLYFPVKRLRGDAEARRENRLGQEALWRFGISGDFPLVLLRLSDVSHASLARHLMLAHLYLRSRGVPFELLLLVDSHGSYMQHLFEDIEHELRGGVHQGVVDQNGGIFLRHKHHMSVDELLLLEAHASVVLDGTRGNFEEQIFNEADDTASWAPFSVIQSRRDRSSLFDPSETQVRGEQGEFQNSYGAFTSQGRSFTVDVRGHLRPPLPWSNILANPNFGTLVTESGGGYTWSGNCRENRLTPWSNDPVTDPLGEILYIRDRDSRDIWTPTPGPGLNSRRYLVEHGFGYSSFKTVCQNVSSELCISVSHQHPVKWWHLTLHNGGSQERVVDLYLYVEWTLGVNREKTSRTLVPCFYRDAQCLAVSNKFRSDFSQRQAFIGSNLDVLEFGFDRSSFIGRNGHLQQPRSLVSRRGVLHSVERAFQNSGRGNRFEELVDEPAGIIRTKVRIPAQSRIECLFFLAEAESTEATLKNSIHYRSLDFYHKDLAETKEYWRDQTSKITVNTPSRDFDVMMNGWLVYQTMASRLFGRTGFYQSGGAFGFRDQLQDVLSLIPLNPEQVRQQILLHAAHQFEEGDVQHWWHPPSGKGVRTKITDDLVWLPYVTYYYLKATGDYPVLNESVAFLRAAELGDAEEAYFAPAVSPESATLFEHCKRALQRAAQFGTHGLPLIGTGDWNDGMNKVGHEGKGESVWLGWFLGLSLELFAELAESRDESFAQWCRETTTNIFSALNQSSWDGEWYRRAYFDDGTPLGSATNDECKIDSISQTWGIISGGAPRDRALKALEAVEKFLVDRNGSIIKLLSPPFDKGSLEPGYIKGYLPGVRENGGQYTHAATWVIIAQSILGHGGKAFDLLRMTLPLNHCLTESGVERYQGEPYVLCGDVYGVEPHVGRAGWSWYTGSAGWMYTAGLRYILGLTVFDGFLRIDPCIPSSWKEYSLDVRIRDCHVQIRVKNPMCIERGVREISVNNRVVNDKKIALQPGETIAVEVIMGIE